MKYICNECGAVFDKIPRGYRGFSGDHFGGSETMLPGCTHCGKYDFSQYTDDGHREILALREQVKVLREALENAADTASRLHKACLDPSRPKQSVGEMAGFLLDTLNAALKHAKPKY